MARRARRAGVALVAVGVLAAGVVTAARTVASPATHAPNPPGLSTATLTQLKHLGIQVQSLARSPGVDEGAALQAAQHGPDSRGAAQVREAGLGRLHGGGRPIDGCQCWVVSLMPQSGKATSDDGLLHLRYDYMLVNAQTGRVLAALQGGTDQPLPGASAEDQYWRAIDHLTQQARFRIRGTFRFLIPPGNAGHFDVRFTAPDHLSSAWLMKLQEVSNGPFRYDRRTSGSQLRTILSNLLLPQDSSEYLFPGQGYGLDDVRFQSASVAARTGSAGGQLEVITIVARGYPWLCSPRYTCPHMSPSRRDRINKYRGVLTVDVTTGLPLSFSSTDSWFGKVSRGQDVTFTYAGR